MYSGALVQCWRGLTLDTMSYNMQKNDSRSQDDTDLRNECQANSHGTQFIETDDS